MIKILCDIFMYIFEALLLYNYTDSLFHSSKTKTVKIISISIVSLILFVIYQFGNTIVNMVAMFILYVILFCNLFNTRIKTAIFHTVLFECIMVTSEISVVNLCSLIFNDFDAMFNDINAYIFVITISKIMYASIMLFTKKLCISKFNEMQKDSFFWFLFLFPFISAIMSLLFFFIAGKIEMSSVMSLIISGIFVLLLFTNLIIFVIYDRANKNREELYMLKTEKFQQELDEKYFDAIEQSQEEIKYFSHDMKNYLLQIKYFESIEEIHQYLDEIIENVEKISYVRISSNKMLNLIISKYSAICEKKRIKFIPEVKLANLKYIEDVDLSTLLNNLLDNAVEAAEATQNGRIELSIFSKNSKFDGIILKNSCATPPKHINNELITSKKDKLLHGLGVNIVKKVLKKYDGIYDWNYNETRKMFETSIVFPKS